MSPCPRPSFSGIGTFLVEFDGHRDLSVLHPTLRIAHKRPPLIICMIPKVLFPCRLFCVN